MKTRHYYHTILAVSLFFFAFLCGSCSEEILSGSETTTEGLVLRLEVDGQLAVSENTRALESDESLMESESTVNTVDVFFLQDDAVKVYKHASVSGGKATLYGADWKTAFAGIYDVYVLANVHTPSAELSSIKTKSELLTLRETDENVVRAQGEQSGNGEYQGKTFLMDGYTQWNASAETQPNVTIDVVLTRAAAKLVVNLKYTEEFLKEGRNIVSVSKKLVHYTQDVRALAEGTELDNLERPVQADASIDGFSLANKSDNKGTVNRTDIIYAYSYPNDWGNDDMVERETYFLINIPYVDGSETEGDYQNNYYKVPVRASSNSADLRLDRNKEYTVNVTINREGNPEIEEPVELTPTFSVANWKTQAINIDEDTPQYLMVSETYIEMHNVADTVVTFFSSSTITVTLESAYYVDKYGKEVSLTESAYDWYSVDYDESTLSGKLKIHSDIPEIVTARYVTLKITNVDGMEKTINIIQYPLEYISGVPGLYSYVEQYEKNGEIKVNGEWPSNLAGMYSADIREGLDGHIGTNPYMKSKFYWEGVIYRIDYSYKDANEYNPLYVTANTPADNNRMYLVQISSTSDQYTVARPNLTNTEGELVTALGEENNKLVSPTFMLASNLGNIGNVDWVHAQDNCKHYVEYSIYTIDEADRLSGKKYDGKGHRRFDDWRLPTYAELQIIAGYQENQGIVMDKVLTGQYYWAADKNTYLKIKSETESKSTDKEIPIGTDSKSDGKVRCIRDVSPEDLEEFRAHGIK